jgi:DNA-binding Lrp family transcriptional regulator
MRAKIDKVDVQIIKLLSKNSRLTYKELAEKLKTTRQRVSRRLDKLEKMGIIKKYTLIPDFERLGYVYVILGVTLKPGVPVDPIIEKLKEDEDVKIIERAIGSHSLILHLVAPTDMKKIEKKVNEISQKIDGIDKMDITFITEIVKFEIL